ncbi:FecR family protein [Brevundimonas sp. NPDC092305]|uniref:FecR family protein n=1 Tax=Brevundimonas sp. NPDC092305 TaxID=3363957 RepID=UPI0037F21931
MSNPTKRVEPAELEAAAWHARLGAPRVPPETIEAFFAWRQAPANAEAYRRVEQAWTKTDGLAGDPVIADALNAALSRRPKAGRQAFMKPVLGGALALAAMAALAGAWTWAQGRGVYATSIGEQRTVQLADGSSVRLDTGSKVRVRFTGDRRTVELETGQALFTVAHDTARPFTVVAGETRVTAVGTVFDVRHAGDGIKVTLVSGAVDVLPGEGAGRSRLSAGQQARVGDGAVRLAAVDTAVETSWADGRVVFRDTPLQEAVTEVNRYLTDPIVLDAPAMARESVNGVFKTGDRDAFVSAATEALGLTASPGADGAVRLSAEK